MLRSLFQAFAVLFLPVAASLAAPVVCPTGSLSTYLSLSSEGCFAGSKIFSGFSLVDPTFGSQIIDPTSVGVAPLTDDSREGLAFSFTSPAVASQINESFFLFNVSSPNSQIARSRLTLSGGSAIGDGVALALTDLCFGSFSSIGTCSGAGDSLLTLVTAEDGILTDLRTFDPAMQLAARPDVVIDGGLSGSATLSSVELRFESVPEPGTLLPVLAVLLSTAGLAHYRRRRSSTNR